MKKTYTTITVTKFISEFFPIINLTGVFMVTSWGAMFLIDAFSRNKIFRRGAIN
jgi:hypothetical protein